VETPAAGAPYDDRNRAVCLALVAEDVGICSVLQQIMAKEATGWNLVWYGGTSRALAALPKSASDVVLMDVSTPSVSGIYCTRRLRALLPQLPVVVLAGRSGPDEVLQSIMSGACGYLIKPISGKHLIAAVTAAIKGRPFLCEEAVDTLFRFIRCMASCTCPMILTKREREVAGLLAADASDKQVANDLGISVSTVHVHAVRIFRKLGVHNRAEVGSWFFKNLTSPMAGC
jgi:DNA-binding NarL/FixJ family response regulator